MNDNGRRRFGVLEGVFILMAAGYLFYALTASSNDPANMDSPPVLEESVATLIPNGEFTPPFSSVPTQGSTSTTMTPAVAVDGTAAKEPRPLPSATAQPTSVSPSTIRNDFDRAVRYTEIGDYTGAIIGFSETLSDEPENTAARIGRAQAYVALQMYTEGIQDFTAVHPDDRTAEQFVLLGDALYAAGILEDALFSYNTAIQTDNTIAAAYYGRGRIYADRERFDLAQDDLERASSMDDSNLAYLHALAGVFLAQERTEEAIELYNRALAITPDDADTLIARGRAHTAAQDYLSADSDFNTVIWADPDNATALYYRGVALHRRGRPTVALLNFNHALSLEPDNPLFLLERGRTHIELEDYQPAEDDLTFAVDERPEDAQAWLLLGDVYAATARPDEALEAYRQHIALAEATPAARAINYITDANGTQEPAADD